LVEQYRRPYLDSSVFIAWIMGEVREGVGRAQIAASVIRLAEQRVYPIITSAATLAEVHKHKGLPRLTSDQDQTILAFFEQEFIQLVTVDRRIGERANQLCREYGLNPFDGIHVASALAAQCDVLLAWDPHLTNTVIPGIRLEAPQILGQIPLELEDE